MDILVLIGLPGWLSSKEYACQCRRGGFLPWVRKIPWRRAWQRTPVFLPGWSLDRGAWWATVHRAAKSRHNGSDLTHTARQYILGTIRLARHNDFIMWEGTFMWSEVKVKITQSCPWNSPGQNAGVGRVDLPNPGIKPRSPALQEDSLPTELSGKPYIYVRSLWF